MTDATDPTGPRLGNKLVCPECGEVRLETPPGTTILPTLGMAKKASGAAGPCSCGRRPGERPAPVPADTFEPAPSGATATDPTHRLSQE